MPAGLSSGAERGRDAAPPLVLLHGIGTGPEAWQPQVGAFARTRTVLTPRVAPVLDRAVRDLESSWSGRADLCGLSWGSLVALRIAIEQPERVSRLVLTACFASLPPHLRAFQRALAALVRVVPGAPHDLAAPMREGAGYDVRDRLQRVEAPTLVLCGARDRVNQPLSRRLAALLPGSRLEVIPAAGHLANVDNPAAFNTSLAAFLTG